MGIIAIFNSFALFHRFLHPSPAPWLTARPVWSKSVRDKISSKGAAHKGINSPAQGQERRQSIYHTAGKFVQVEIVSRFWGKILSYG
jgi:hypothetical protein